MNDRPITKTECVIVAGTAFSCSCAAFALSALFLVPVIGAILQSIDAPSLAQKGTVLFCLFGLPIVAAIKGINIGARFLERPSAGNPAT